MELGYSMNLVSRYDQGTKEFTLLVKFLHKALKLIRLLFDQVLTVIKNKKESLSAVHLLFKVLILSEPIPTVCILTQL